MKADYNDYQEGLRTEHAEYRREMNMLRAIERQHKANLDDYPEIYY